MPTKDQSFARFCSAYRALLLLYPASHRSEYGDLMVQLFRDQCRSAHRESGRRGLWLTWSRLLPDLFLTATQERLTNLTHNMKTPSINKLTHVLFAASIGCALLTSPTVTGPQLATVLVYLSTLLILARAAAEWFRPPGEAMKAIGWGIAVLVAFGFIMPFWAKLQMMYGSGFSVAPAFIGGSVFLNIIVPVTRAVIDRTRRIA